MSSAIYLNGISHDIRFWNVMRAQSALKSGNIVSLTESEEEKLSSRWYGISEGKTKLMVNNPGGTSTDIRVNGEGLETVKTFKYLRAIILSDQG